MAVMAVDGQRSCGHAMLQPVSIFFSQIDGAAACCTADFKAALVIHRRRDMGSGQIHQLHARQVGKLQMAAFGIPDSHDHHHRMFTQRNPAGFLGIIVKAVHNVVTQQMRPDPDHFRQQADHMKIA